MNFQRYFISAYLRNGNVLSILRRNMNDFARTHKPTNFEKKVLVWTKTGNYKTVEEIPEYVGLVFKLCLFEF